MRRSVVSLTVLVAPLLLTGCLRHPAEPEVRSPFDTTVECRTTLAQRDCHAVQYWKTVLPGCDAPEVLDVLRGIIRPHVPTGELYFTALEKTGTDEARGRWLCDGTLKRLAEARTESWDITYQVQATERKRQGIEQHFYHPFLVEVQGLPPKPNAATGLPEF